MPAVALAPIESERARGQRELDEVIVEVWRELADGHSSVCPVCDGEMDPEYGAPARPIAGRCRECGTRLT